VYEQDCGIPVLPDVAVVRSQLVHRVLDADPGAVVQIVGPAGSGKTSLGVQVARASARPVAWVTVNRHSATPLSFLQHVAAARHEITPLPDAAITSLHAPEHAWATVTLPSLLTAFRHGDPFLLVVDDAHHLATRDALDCLGHLAAGLPADVQLLIASRGELKLHLGPVHRYRSALVIGPDELAFTRGEVGAWATAAGVVLGEDVIDTLVSATEGWAAAVSIALTHARSRPAMTGEGRLTKGAETVLADYLDRELVDDLASAERDFLTRTSVLDVMTGDLCDHVLATSGSADMLDALTRAGGLFVSGGEESPRWYRGHALLRQVLLTRLRADTPEAVPVLHRRALHWFLAHEDVTRAIEHAVLAGDLPCAADLVFADAFDLCSTGRATTLSRRLSQFTDTQIHESAELCLARAVLSLAAGDKDGLDRYVARALALPEHSPLSDGTPSVAAAAAVLASIAGTDPGPDLLTSLDWLSELESTVSSLCAAGILIRGTILWQMGEHASAAGLLQRTERAWVRNPSLEVAALAYLALVADEEGDADRALHLATRAERCLAVHHLRDNPILVNAVLMLALLDARAGRAHRAVEKMQLGRRLLAMIDAGAPRARLLAACLLAEILLDLADIDGARTALRGAEPLKQREAWAIELTRRHARIEEELAARARLDGARHEIGPASLTTAELRVVAYLPTHLSLREIGERIYRSPHTVKSQTMSVYRKLGVNSRSEAVERARELGLIT